MIARRLLVALALISAAPAALFAQRSGAGGFGHGRLPGSLTRETGLVVPQQVNMINLMIQHRQEIALSDSQFMRVIGFKRALDSSNAPTMRRLDSLSRLFRGGTPIFSEPSIARRDSIAEARSVMRELLAAVRENNDAARDKAYELLNEQQLLKAREVESAAEKALAEEEKKQKP